MKPELWEEKFDKQFSHVEVSEWGWPSLPSTTLPDRPHLKDVTQELKDFIRSLVEKTRKEAEDEHMNRKISFFETQTTEEMRLYKAGYKAGLERAVRLVPREWYGKGPFYTEDGSAQEANAWEDCREEMFENLKKELEK